MRIFYSILAIAALVAALYFVAASEFFKPLLENRPSAIVTWVGTIVTVLGLVYASVLAAAARDAAVEAKDAAEEAVEEFQSRLSISDISLASSQLDLVFVFSKRKDYQAAMSVLPLTRRLVHRSLIHAQNNGQDLNDIELIKRNFRVIAKQVGAGKQNKTVMKAATIKAFEGTSEFLSSLEGALALSGAKAGDV